MIWFQVPGGRRPAPLQHPVHPRKRRKATGKTIQAIDPDQRATGNGPTQ